MGVAPANNFSKEMSIRKKIASIFNKREEDFDSLREYNDYLEEVEDMTFDLIEGINEAEINAKIERYRRENAEQIANSQARKAEELAAALKASKGPAMQMDTIDQGFGQTFQGEGAGAGVSVQGQYAPAAVPGGVLGQPRPTQPAPIGGGANHMDSMEGCGADDEESMKLRADRAARAGGWTIEFSKKRTLEEAFNSMWL